MPRSRLRTKSSVLAGELKERVARSAAWSIVEKIGTMLLQLGVSLVILRLLTREDFGVMAVFTAFAAVALVVADSGFSQALIRKSDPSPGDFKAVFLFNIVVSLLLYALLVCGAPLAARLYDMPQLVRLAPAFFLLLPVNALCVVQQTIFMRSFRFALLSKVTLFSSLVSGLAAILMALAGWGIWSLVAQRLLQTAVRALLLWWLSDWRPAAGFDVAALRGMAPFGCGVMATDLISTLYNKIPQLLIGRLYSAETLGSFDQAVKIKDMPVTSVTQAVQGVTYPALSKIVGDEARFAESYRQVVMVVCYAMFPMMAGMSAVADDLFGVLLDEKWRSMIPYFRVVSLSGLFYPVAMIAYNVLKVKCGGGAIVRLEVLKKLLMTVIFAVTIPRSVEAVTWGLVAIAFCEMAVNVAATLRRSQLSLLRLLRSVAPAALLSAVMYGAVAGVRYLLQDGGELLRLGAGVATGVAVYGLLSALFRPEAFRETLAVVKRQMAR